VEMIAHQAKGMHLPPGPLASLAKRLQKAEAILVVQVNVFATVTAIHNVIDRPGILNSKRSSRAPQTSRPVTCSKKNVAKWRSDPNGA
jgi:hypothetical protein